MELSIPPLESSFYEDEISKEEFEKQFMSGYLSVFNEFCCTSAKHRGLSFQDPPEYDVGKLEILRSDAEGQRAEIVVQAAHGYERVFRLKLEDEKWKIAERLLTGFKDGTNISEAI